MPHVVLIVDDDPLILELTSEMAKGLGCEVQTADCARKALAKLEADPRIALLLTDVQMPGMCGYELAARAQAWSPGLRVVLMSGKDLGGKGYTVVRKPFTEPQLERALEFDNSESALPIDLIGPPTTEGFLVVAIPASIIPADEPQRMAAVKRYDILDTPADGSFDRVTAIAARRFDVPISIISIVDNDRIWFKSHHGVNVSQIDRNPGLCASAILKNEPYILVDASQDMRSLANPLVAGDFGLRFYAGVPLSTSDGYNLGTLCVIDKEPRPVTQEQIEDLKDLAAMVIDQLEFRLSARRALGEADKALAQSKLLAREIDHRVMNSLQFVSAMLHLQSKGAGEAARDHLDAAANRVAAVARVHRHFHLETDASQVTALIYLRRLCDDLSGILGVRVDVDGDPDLLPTESIQPVGLIVNELVTNAAKHGVGTITVTYKSRDSESEVVVCDQGEGLPDDFDPARNTRGLGMKVVDVLAKQLGGGVAARANAGGKGACFAVTFPR